MGISFLKFTSSSKQELPYLSHNLSIQIFPANTDKKISTTIVQQLQKNISKQYPCGTEIPCLKIDLEIEQDWKARFTYPNSRILWNPNKKLKSESKQFAESLGAYCDHKLVVQNMKKAGDFNPKRAQSLYFPRRWLRESNSLLRIKYGRTNQPKPRDTTYSYISQHHI